MKVLVTGANGFVGKNLVATLHELDSYEVYSYDIENSKEDLKKFTKDCNFVVHLAGVNRPQNPQEFYEGNAGFTETLCKYMQIANNKAPILISSSIQAEKDNDYGKSKKEGEEALLKFGTENGNPIFIYRFTNLFGKWCRPNYNSVVATWCYNIARDIDIQINDENAEIQLCYIDDVVREIISAINNKKVIDNFQLVDPQYKITLGELADIIRSFRLSRKTLFLPNMGNDLVKKLYSTYLSYLPEQEFKYPIKMNVDNRGSFTELLKTQDFGQISVNISKPGITKGNHWHHSKNEKFIVVSGEGLLQFRNIFSKDVIEYHVDGEHLEIVDIPTGYTHNIINLGENDLITIMWANEVFDKDHPDTYYKEV